MQVLKTIHRYAHSGAGDVEKLRPPQRGLRLRSGDWRVFFFEPEPGTLQITMLRRHWGYDSFRPLQERIVNSLLQERDVAVVMPTGGGKSLCYQLPALMSRRTAIVISPLISLMHDQTAPLKQMGIPAAVLNSSLTAQAQSQIMRDACAGAYRLLYLSPERLVRDDTAAWLARVPIAFFAIDEAHCISEWGHEFRPEYRQLSRLRQQFPDRPIAAFTASATQRVRHDILLQLQMRDADKYIASFHRPNLRYLIRQCDAKTQPRLLLSAVRAYRGSNMIVYAPTVKRVEETVDFLGDRGIQAVAYHGQMDTAGWRTKFPYWSEPLRSGSESGSRAGRTRRIAGGLRDALANEG